MGTGEVAVDRRQADHRGVEVLTDIGSRSGDPLAARIRHVYRQMNLGEIDVEEATRRLNELRSEGSWISRHLGI